MGGIENKENNLDFKLIKKVEELDPIQVISGNNHYLIIEEDPFVYIYDIETKKKININSHFSIIKMHPKYENIFILTERNIAIIYEIIAENSECKERAKVTGYNQAIKLVEFSEKYDKIFGIYSEDKTLKIWDLGNAFCVCNILIVEPINEFQFHADSIFYFNDSEICITEFNYKELYEFNYKNIKTKNFIVLNNDAIISIKKNHIIKYIKGKEIKRLELNGFTKTKFYDKKLEILYLVFGTVVKEIVVIDIKLMNVIYSVKTFFSNIIYLNNSFNEEYMIPNFILITTNIEYYYLGKKMKTNNFQKQDIIPFLPDKNFWDKTIFSISSIENLDWKANIIEDFNYKKYLDNVILAKDIDDNYKKSLENKREEVEKELELKKNFDYIQLLKMVIKDNTNKDLIEQYLKMLQKDKVKTIIIDFEGKEIYDDEYEKYKNMFTINELKSYGLKEKAMSQKDDFLNFLQEILGKQEDDIENFKETIKNELENLQLFNQAIDFENEELYWYRNKLIVYFALDKILNEDENKYKNNNNNNINDSINNNTKIIININNTSNINNNKYERFELMKKNIEKIIERNLLKDDSIIKDKVLLTTLMIIIAIPLPLDLLEFNLNLIYTKSKNYKFEDELKKYNLTLIKNNDCLMNINQKNPKASNMCITNFELNISKKMNLNEIELNNYDFMKKEFNKIIDFNKMYLFLSKIACSQVFRDAFKILYPDYLEFPFKDENDSKKFLKKYLNFIPFKSYRTGAVTEKFSLEIYIFLKIRKVNISPYFGQEIKELIIKILYLGSFVVTFCHEMNHEFYNIFLKHSNGRIPLETPRKQFIDEKEGGINMEKLLFNRRVKKISLIECLYLLNENNYNKNLNQFREGLNELKMEDIKMKSDCVFYDLNQILNQKNFDYISRTTNISCDENYENDFLKDSYIDDLENENDVLGFLRNPL